MKDQTDKREIGIVGISPAWPDAYTTLETKEVEDMRSELTQLRADLAAAREGERVMREALRKFLRISESWPLWAIIVSLCDGVKFGFDHYDMRPDGWEAWSHHEKVGRQIAREMLRELPPLLSTTGAVEGGGEDKVLRQRLRDFIIQLRAGEVHCKSSKDSAGIATGSALKTIAGQIELMLSDAARKQEGEV